MDRRTFLKTTAGAGAMVATGALATPAISQNAAAKTLRFVPQANLANFDPIWGTQYVVRNASVLVWDTLYGFDEKLFHARALSGGLRQESAFWLAQGLTRRMVAKVGSMEIAALGDDLDIARVTRGRWAPAARRVALRER